MGAAQSARGEVVSRDEVGPRPAVIRASRVYWGDVDLTPYLARDDTLGPDCGPACLHLTGLLSEVLCHRGHRLWRTP